MQAIVNETIREKVTSLAGVPSWMLVLLNNVLETTGKQNLFEVWPSLEVYFHGGVSFEPYALQYQKYSQRRIFDFMRFIMLQKVSLPARIITIPKNSC